MPTYDYRCPNGHDFERFYRKISEAASEVACPVCNATAHRRVSGGAGLVFKGSGFYLTDYGKNAHRKAGPSSANGEGSGESKTSGGGESSKGETGAAGTAKPEGASTGSGKADPSKSADTSSTSKPKGESGK